MQASGSQRPRVAHVEDYDDERGTIISDTRAFARAGKDGSDSGYSSRTGTLGSEPNDTGKSADMRSRGVPIERERQPYSGGPIVKRRESVSQQKPTHPKPPENTAPPKEEQFRHPKGICWSCDTVGYHMTQEEFEDVATKSKSAQPRVMESPKAAKKPSRTQMKERDADPKPRKMSSSREQRPVYPPSATQPMIASYNTPMAYYGTSFATPATPAAYAPQGAYQYATYAPSPATPTASPYVAQPSQQGYFAQNVPEIAPPRPRRRDSLYADPDVPRPQRRYIEPPQPRWDDDQPEEVVRSSQRPAAQMTRHQSSRSIDRDRYEEDLRRRMPPPEVPLKRSEASHRPSVKKSYTYDDNGHERTRSSDMSEEVAAQVLERRRSRNYRSYDPDADRGSHAPPTRDVSPSRAPASYRKPAAEPSSRPQNRHSVSYTDSRHAQSVVKTAAPHDSTQRRVTEPLTPMDVKVAEAEAYQQKRSSMTGDDLSAENIKSLKGSKGPSQSDAGSHYSHRESHYSSSKVSSSTRKARRDSIIIETAGLDQPLSIQLPSFTVQIGSEKDGDKDKSSKQKLIEHAPASGSTVSRSSISRHRAATSSHASSDRGKDKAASNRTSQIIDSRPPASPIKTSSKASRAPSRSRAASDANSSRPRRHSVVVSERVVLGG